MPKRRKKAARAPDLSPADQWLLSGEITPEIDEREARVLCSREGRSGWLVRTPEVTARIVEIVKAHRDEIGAERLEAIAAILAGRGSELFHDDIRRHWREHPGSEIVNGHDYRRERPVDHEPTHRRNRLGIGYWFAAWSRAHGRG